MSRTAAYNIPNTPGSTPAKGTLAQRNNSPLAASFTLVQKTKDMLREQLVSDWASSKMDRLRVHYAILDLAYYMESSEHLKNSDARKIVTAAYKEMELPVLQPNIDAAHAYLVGVFLSGHPIFGVVGEGKDRTAAAQQMEAIIEENSRSTGWKRQFIKFFKAGLKYNLAAVEVDWRVRRSFNLETDTAFSFTEASKKEVMRAGNEVRNLDMYNTAFDTSVPPADVHTRGDFVINVELLTLAQLHSFMSDLKANGGILMGEGDSLWNSSSYHNWYHVPRLAEDRIQVEGTDWVSFFSTGATPMTQDRTRKYEVVHYYRRIIPSMFGINTADANMVQIWRFVFVNGILIFAERKSNAHNYLPVVISQPIEDGNGLQSKGLGATLLNFQNMTGAMFRARLANLARSLSDRGLFDPSRIDPKHINSAIPTAKIPVKPSAYGKSLSDAYYPIPFDDRNGQTLYSDIGQVNNWASDAAHINRSQRGQFTKGNRTLAEYMDVQDNADATQYTMALLIEEQCFVPIKYMVKTNILQYQNSLSLPDPNTNQLVEIDPAELRKALIEFRLSDGLLPKDKIMGVQATLEAFQIMAMFPEAGQKYDMTRMLVTTMENKGARIAQFEWTPEELQQRQQMQLEQIRARQQGGAPAQEAV